MSRRPLHFHAVTRYDTNFSNLANHPWAGTYILTGLEWAWGEQRHLLVSPRNGAYHCVIDGCTSDETHSFGFCEVRLGRDSDRLEIWTTRQSLAVAL